MTHCQSIARLTDSNLSAHNNSPPSPNKHLDYVVVTKAIVVDDTMFFAPFIPQSIVQEPAANVNDVSETIRALENRLLEQKRQLEQQSELLTSLRLIHSGTTAAHPLSQPQSPKASTAVTMADIVRKELPAPCSPSQAIQGTKSKTSKPSPLPKLQSATKKRNVSSPPPKEVSHQSNEWTVPKKTLSPSATPCTKYLHTHALLTESVRTTQQEASKLVPAPKTKVNKKRTKTRTSHKTKNEDEWLEQEAQKMAAHKTQHAMAKASDDDDEPKSKHKKTKDKQGISAACAFTRRVNVSLRTWFVDVVGPLLQFCHPFLHSYVFHTLTSKDYGRNVYVMQMPLEFVPYQQRLNLLKPTVRGVRDFDDNYESTVRCVLDALNLRPMDKQEIAALASKEDNAKNFEAAEQKQTLVVFFMYNQKVEWSVRLFRDDLP